MNIEELKQELVDTYDQLLFYDDFDDAIIGVASIVGKSPAVAYDYYKCIEILSEHMTEEEAREDLNFNYLSTFLGDGTPVFIDTVEFEEEYDEEEKKWKRQYIL